MSETEPLTNERESRAREWVRQLSEIPARFAGTHSERQAAEHIGSWMTQLGLTDVTYTAAPARPRSGFSIALHGAVSFLGLWVGGLFGLLLAGFAAVSFWMEQTSSVLLLSRLLRGDESINVLARCGSIAPRRRILLSAHIDTTQAGLLFRPQFANLFAHLQDLASGPPTGPLALPHALLTVAAILGLGQWLGAHGFLFLVGKLAIYGALLILIVLMIEWALAPATPGANDNASAVASMLTCAETLRRDLPDDVELWVAGTGAEEVGHGGMIHALRPEWPKDSTYCINFECTGGGNLHIIHTEGLLKKVWYPPTLLEVGRRVAASGKFGEVTPVDLLAGTDGCVAAKLGYPTLSLISLEANGVPRNYHRVEDTVDGIDPSMLVRAGDFGAAVARAALQGAAEPLP